MQKFPKYDSYFRATNKRKELLLLEGAVGKKGLVYKSNPNKQIIFSNKKECSWILLTFYD